MDSGTTTIMELPTHSILQPHIVCLPPQLRAQIVQIREGTGLSYFFNFWSLTYHLLLVIYVVVFLQWYTVYVPMVTHHPVILSP